MHLKSRKVVMRKGGSLLSRYDPIHFSEENKGDFLKTNMIVVKYLIAVQASSIYQQSCLFLENPLFLLKDEEDHIEKAKNHLSSTTTPIISPVNSYIMTCNLLNSKYSIPNTTFFSLPLSGSLGTLITSNVSSIVYNMINPQSYNEIVITFFDQYFNALVLHDFDCTITLAIKEPDIK